MPRRRIAQIALVVSLVLLAAACGSDGDASDAEAAASDSTSASSAATTSTTALNDDASNDDAASDDASALTVAADWQLTRVGPGIKPAVALDAAGAPTVAFMTEAQDGGVFSASAASDWAIETVAEGYFYGPIDLAFGPDDTQNIVYHDHQGPTFDPALGDLTLAQGGSDGWTLSPSGDAGHDGWDSTIRFGPDGQLWAAGIEPSDFGTSEGVEFYEFVDGAWTVESVGGPAITYEFNVSIATTPDGEPALSYFDDVAGQLRVATRTASGWVDEAVTDPGGGGMFSSFIIDDQGTRYISFFRQATPSSGEVVYAVDTGSGWQLDTIANLEDIEVGMFGARRVTSLQLLDDGTPVVAYTDRSGIWLATGLESDWQIEQILIAGGQPLGQQVQLVVDGDAMHVVSFETTNSAPLEGEILYLNR
jgi:hypothetical protein